MKKSHIIRLKSLIAFAKQITEPFFEDRVTVYAAQASFFVIISAVPFLSLLIAVIGLVETTDLPTLTESLHGIIPSPILNAFAELMTELKDIPSISLVSISALTTLWSASKGISAIRNGLQTVYGIERKRGFFRSRLYSLLYTVCFIAMLLTAAIILLFGDYLYGVIAQSFPDSTGFLPGLLRFKSPILLVLISLVFNTMYSVIGNRSSRLPKSFFFHLPGAALAALGFSIFSSMYSLYITHFPKAFSLYGGLTAICLIMLWIYFCMVIFLCGAEVNKLLLTHKKQKK